MSVITNFVKSRIIPYKEDLYANLTGAIVQKSDGYYFEDASSKGNDCKLVNSFAYQYTGLTTPKSYMNLGTTVELLVTPADNAVTIYEFWMRIDDLTVTQSAYNKSNILYNGTDSATYGGIIIAVNLDKLVIRLSSKGASSIVTYTSVNSLDTNWHLYTITVDTATKVITINVDGVIETINITNTGNNFATIGTSNAQLGPSGNESAKFSIARFRVTKSGSSVLDIPFSSVADYGGGPARLYDRINGTAFLCYNCNRVNQDIYPANILNGFELYRSNSSSTTFSYIPHRTNGALITPSIAAYTKVGNYPAGSWHNFAETQVSINGTAVSASTMITYPFTKYFPVTDELKVYNIYAYKNTKIPSQIKKILRFKKYILPRTVVSVGDSIINGGGFPLVAELPAYLQVDQPLAKIYDVVAGTIQTLTKDNSDQYPYANAFSEVLNLAYVYGKEIWLCGYSLGGAHLATDFLVSPEGARLTSAKTSITAMAREMIKNGRYPFFEFYCSLGTNDAGTPSERDAFQVNFSAFISHLRSFVSQPNAEFHVLKPRNTGDRIIVNNAIITLSTTTSNYFMYDPEIIASFYDSVHPNTQGAINLGRMFANKEYIGR